jgi:hypothetical protein
MDRLPDIYYSRDFPVLVVIGRWEEQGRPQGFLRAETVAEELVLPLDQVIQSIGRLYHAGLVDAADASTFGGEEYMIRRLTAHGLQESGLWRTRADDLAIALRQVLEREIETERANPERKRLLKSVLDVMSQLDPEAVGKIANVLLKWIGSAIHP